MNHFWLGRPTLVTGATGLVGGAVVRRLVRERAGRVIASVCPDISSGFAVAAVAGEVGILELPLSVCGTTGGNIFHHPESAIAKEFWGLNAESGLACHARVPCLESHSALYAEAFQQVKDHLLPTDAGLSLDRLTMALNCLAEYRIREDADRTRAIDTIAATLNDVPELKAAFVERSAAVPSHTYRSPASFADEKMWVGLRNDKWFCFNAADYGVVNVYEAVRLAGRIAPASGAATAVPEWLARTARGLTNRSASDPAADADRASKRVA